MNNITLTIAAVSAAVVVFATLLVVGTNQLASVPPAHSISTPTNVSSKNTVVYGDFGFNMCDQGKDPMVTPGEGEDPAKASRSLGDKVTLPFCVTSSKTNKVILVDFIEPTNPTTGQRDLIKLSVFSNGTAVGKTRDGMTVYVDKPKLRTNEMTKLAVPSPGENITLTGGFHVTFVPSTDAELGVHRIGISMFEPDSNGVTGLRTTVYAYVNVVQ